MRYNLHVCVVERKFNAVLNRGATDLVGEVVV